LLIFNYIITNNSGVSQMADPAAAATDAAKAAGNKAMGAITTIANQTLNPKYWVRNAGIVALTAVFAPAVVAAAAPGGTSALGAFAGKALGQVSLATTAITTNAPQAVGVAMSKAQVLGSGIMEAAAQHLN
jgi:hypothetical protein